MHMVTPEAFIKARALADKLMATCHPPEYWDDIEALSPLEQLALDGIAFECQICNHWFPVAAKKAEFGGGWLCVDCV